jgi:exopolysaccharide production protein ExoZ
MIWSLQILRFIAALMVVYLHVAQSALSVTGSAGSIPLELTVMGYAGVDIFFVLSGVVIARTAPGMTSAQFAWRRIRRILPIYLVACVPAMLQAAKTGFGWRDVLATLLLWPATDVMTAPLLGVAWTLSFEMLFYLSTALVLYDRRYLYVLGVLYAIAFALRPFGPLFQFLGNPLVIEFLLGVAIAFIPSWRGGIVCVPFGFAALSLAGLLHNIPQAGTLEALTGQQNLYRVFVWGLPSALIVYGFMQIRARENVWTNLGDASYSIYLFHGFAVGLLLALWSEFPVHPDLIIIIGMIAAVLLSWRIHVLIEAPILKAIPARGFQSIVASKIAPPPT